MNLSTFGLGSSLYGGILLIEPAAHGRWLLLVGALDGLLWCEAPATQLQAYTLQRQADTAALFNEQSYRLACPQREIHLQLIRGVVNDQAA